MSNQIAPRHVFGLKGDVTNNVFHLDDSTIVYPAGNFVVIYSIDSKTQTLIPCSADSLGITAMAISRSRKYLAVAEKSDKAMIAIIDLHTRKKRNKSLVTSEAQSSRYVSLSWSPDEEWLIAQGAEPEWKLVLWRWQRSQVMFSDKVQNNNQGEAYQCLFHPTNVDSAALVTVIGSSINRVLKLVVENREGMLKSVGYGMGKVGEAQSKLLTCHAWLIDGDKERMLLGTEMGEVYVLDPEHQWEPVKVLQGPEGVAASCIVPYSSGKAFVVGGTSGTLMFYAAQDNEKDPYRFVRSVQIRGETGAIRSISIPQSEEHVVLTTSTNQMWIMELGNTEAQTKADESPVRLLAAPFHSGEITGLDTCSRKPLLVTCSASPEDSTIKLWNFNERACELSAKFEEQPLSVALHPTGYVLLAGFTDKLRLMTVLMDGVKTTRELPIKGCRECRFSVGGHLFAATDPQQHTIHVWSTYTGKHVAELSRHANRIWHIEWSADDLRLTSSSSDGMIVEWDMRTFHPLRVHQTRGMYYTAAVLSLDNRAIFAVGSDKGIKEIGEDGETVRHKAVEEEFSSVALSDAGKALFVASDTGMIKALKLPLTGEVVGQAVKAHAMMQGSSNYCVPRMCVGDLGSLLVSAGHDGCVVVFGVTRDKDAKAVERGRDGMPLAEEVLVTKTDLEEKQRQMRELEQKVLDNQSKYEWEMNLLSNKMQEEINKLTAKFTDDLEKDRRNYAKLLAEKQEMEQMYDDKLRSAETQQKADLGALEVQCKDKIQLEAQRYQELVQEMEKMKETYEENDAFLHENHQRQLVELAEEYNRQLREEQERSTRLEQQKQEMARDFEELRQMMEEDADREIQDLSNMFQVALKKESADAERLSKKNASMSQTKEDLEKEIDKLKQDIRRLFDQERQKYAQISAHEKDKDTLRKEMREREETIAEKEKRIYDLKKKNQELEKFKMMLDFKIKGLRTMIEPREAEIAAMKEQVQEMGSELERYQKQNAGLELSISELKLRSQALLKEEVIQKAKLESMDAVVRRFQRDLHHTVQFLGDPKGLKACIKHLYQEYGLADEDQITRSGEVVSEYGRQRDYLERTVESLKRKLAKDAEKSRADNMRIMAEHVALVQEINELRREIKVLRDGDATPNTGDMRAMSETDAFNALRSAVEARRRQVGRLRMQPL